MLAFFLYLKLDHPLELRLLNAVVCWRIRFHKPLVLKQKMYSLALVETSFKQKETHSPLSIWKVDCRTWTFPAIPVFG